MKKQIGPFYLILLLLLPSISQLIVNYIENYFIGFALRIVTHLVIPALIFYWFHKDIFHVLRRVPIRSVLFWSTGTAIVLTAFLIAFTPVLDADLLRAGLSKLYEVTPMVYLAVALMIGIINPILEEYYWRGLIYGESKKLWTDVFFGLHHFVLLYFMIPMWLNLLGLVLLGGVGVFLNWLYSKDNSIINPFFVHLTADVVIVIYGYIVLF